ncbi:hypothetical protein EJB05_40166 [Eragrostis curvula]|uniref:Uncharacterized protein n=1 Tax=Eragrostis curvula TaxID=38414 RepID=A0A5J9TYY5_9POAL|nr:hypothetical protein EJB05_40166 [Eragrostis curvula]
MPIVALKLNTIGENHDVRRDVVRPWPLLAVCGNIGVATMLKIHVDVGFPKLSLLEENFVIQAVVFLSLALVFCLFYFLSYYVSKTYTCIGVIYPT